MRWRPRRRPSPEDVDRHWQRLLSLVEDWGPAHEVARGRIEVSITAWDEDPRHVTFVGPPEEWAVASQRGEGEHGVDGRRLRLVRLRPLGLRAGSAVLS